MSYSACEKARGDAVASTETTWYLVCRHCGYLLPETLVNQAKYDYGCPKCGCSFEQFTYRKREEALEDEGA